MTLILIDNVLGKGGNAIARGLVGWVDDRKPNTPKRSSIFPSSLFPLPFFPLPSSLFPLPSSFP
ncbi:hypothetical protein [Merismopedia glauca]|uniref:hypothetical protein n=1 Tax=Merismopedia glauca TaxID=292586 RepID=UPI0011B28FA4|nr:hypothetical protein [Merismopedia glauca]